MKFYRKAMIKSIVCIICTIAAVGLFQKETIALDLFTDDFSAAGNWTLSGTAAISGGELRIGDPNGIATQTAGVDASACTSVILRFDWRQEVNQTSDAFRVDVFDGLAWQLGVAYIYRNSSDPVDDVNLTAYKNTALQVRFRELLNNSSDNFYIDNLTIYCQLGTTTTTTTTTTLPGATTTTTLPGATTTTTLPSGCSGPKPDISLLTPTLGKTDFGSHTYPTFLFVASYDWLHNFYDRNADGARGGNQTDPDTDNFNKIIALDSNLFPIMTAVYGDHEFPNITARNALTWDSTAASSYSPSINDYFNRSIAVAPNFISQKSLTYSNLTAVCQGVNWEIMATSRDKKIDQYGARSMMQWAFITDPGNSNIRRYEFQKLGGFYAGFDAEMGVELGAIEGEDATSVCNQAVGAWATGVTYDVLDGDPTKCAQKPWQMIPATLDVAGCGSCVPGVSGAPLDGCYENNKVLWTCKHGEVPPGYADSGQNISTGESTAVELADYIANGHYYDYLEVGVLDIADYESGNYTFPIEICGNARDNASDVFGIGINTADGDPRPTNHTNTANGTFAPESDFYVIPSGSLDTNQVSLTPWEKMINTGAYRDCNTYQITVNSSYDLEPGIEGLQIRVRFYAMKQGSFVLDQINIGERDSAFAVKYTGPSANIESRWANLTSYLETIPPESYPGYTTFKHAALRTVGHGYQTNTSFNTARYVRFKNPRDVDVYRDVFDANNEGPVYVFVADTMNSRIQVFMNATGSAGTTNASFPIRPVRVAKRAGIWSDSSLTEYESNELAMRIHTGINNTAVAFGDGRKADWRHYTTATGTTLETIPALAGRGEFYYPHGVAVDQDPNTKDVYLFVADTFNHRIQVFRDTTGVTFQPITDKRFDFQFEEGWGTYPANTTQPGSYNFRYPKGLDIVRFSHNSSLLYVVDSKNYRLLKYLITENDSGGINNIDIQAGYGYKGGTFVRNLTSMRGDPLTVHRSFEANGASAIGFWNPQDVATGYSGFYMYSAPNAGGYPYEVYTTSGATTRTRGVQFLNNYMIYVTDYARNNTTLTTDRLNMRVMQFFEHPQRNLTSFLPWRTETVTFDKGELGHSVFGVYSGSYDSTGRISAVTHIVEGSTNNVPGRAGYFTDRPVGIAAVTWDTVSPFDMRVVNLNSPTRVLYPNGATIDNDTELQVGVRSRGFFGLPYTNVSSYTNYTAERMNLDGSRVKRVHIFCYNTSGVYQNHTALVEVPFEFTPGAAPLSCPAGYMKIIAEDKYFGYSGKTGTMIFQLTD